MNQCKYFFILAHHLNSKEGTENSFRKKNQRHRSFEIRKQLQRENNMCSSLERNDEDPVIKIHTNFPRPLQTCLHGCS